MNAPGRLGDYLRARRELLRPEDVGLGVGTTLRRVTGLRREEVAILAGISTEYYLRLEQGRDAHPSAQVLDALARALQLDPVATVHLHSLALAKHATGPVPLDRGHLVSDGTRSLIESWPVTAAFVHSRYLDVLAANALAQALNPNYRAGVNSILTLLTDPAEQEFHADWEGLAARSIALLRSIADTHSGDARLDALVAAAAESSGLFRELWGRQDVWRVGDGVHTVRHPSVGELTLTYHRLPLVGTDGQSIWTYSAEPGSPSEDALRRLARSG